MRPLRKPLALRMNRGGEDLQKPEKVQELANHLVGELLPQATLEHQRDHLYVQYDDKQLLAVSLAALDLCARKRGYLLYAQWHVSTYAPPSSACGETS